MPQIQIIPTDLFSIFKWFKILFFFSFISFFLSFILLSTYYSLLKKKSTDDDSLSSEKPSSFILYFSTIFSSFSLIGSLLCLYQYIKIFPIFNLNTVSISLYFSIISSIIILTINIYYLGNPNLCGDKKIYDYDLKMCIDKCNIGSYYNKDKKTCVIGCLSSNNCPDNSICNSGQCCDLKNNQIINGFCCKNSYIFSVNGNNICCPSNNICGNVCCIEDSMICDSKTNTCLIKCGDQYCNNNQYCFIGPNISNTSSTIQTCVDKNLDCSLSGENSIQYFPILEGNQHQFQPALLPTQDINDISNILKCDHFQEKSDCSGFQNEFDSDRFYCGSESAIRFMSIPLEGNNCNQYTLSSFIPNNTLQANFINNDNKSLNILMDGNYTKPLSTYKIIQTNDNAGYVTSNTTTYSYKNSNVLPNATLLSSSITSNCYNGKPTVYQPSCNTFQECITDNKCPFDADDDKECKNGIITPIIPVKKKCVPVFDDPVAWSYTSYKYGQANIPYMYTENIKNYQWIINDTRNLDISTPISDNSEITFQLIGAGSFDYNFLVCDDAQIKSPSMRETSFRWKLIKCGEQYYNSKNDYSIYPDSEYILNGQPLFIQVSDTENTTFKNQYLSVNCDSNHPCIKPFSNDNNVYSLMWVIIQPGKLIGDPLETKINSYIIKAAPYGKYPSWSNNLIGSCGNCDWYPCLGFYKNRLKSICKDISELNSIYDEFITDDKYTCTDSCGNNKPDNLGNCPFNSNRLVTIFSNGAQNSTDCFSSVPPPQTTEVVTYCCDNHLYDKFKTFLPNDLYDDNASLTTLICNASDYVYTNPQYSDCNCNKDCLESRNQN